LYHILGFSFLEQISGSMVIAANNSPGLCDFSIEGFNNLRAIGSLLIAQNSLLTIATFDAIETIGNLGVSSNPDLLKLSLAELRTAGQIVISNNLSLQEMNFPNLRDIFASLTIANNGIKYINTFNKLRTVGGAIDIINNFILEVIDGFNELTFVNGASVINYNSQVPSNVFIPININVSYTNPDACHICSQIAVSDTTAIIDINTYNYLTFNPNSLYSYLTCNSQSCACDDDVQCSATLMVYRSIFVADNSNLKIINGFKKLRTTGASLYFLGNSSLKLIDAFESIKGLVDLIIRYNTSGRRGRRNSRNRRSDRISGPGRRRHS